MISSFTEIQVRNEREKLKWTEKLETILSVITSVWYKTIIITGHTNIDYIKQSGAVTGHRRLMKL